MKKKRPKTSRQKLKILADKAVKGFVKKRDKNTCQYCGKTVDGVNCHASHVIPVSQGQKLAYDPMNLKVLCYHHHINWWHKNPLEARNWFASKFPERYEYLMSNQGIKKFTEAELEQIIDKYKENK